MLPHSRAEPNLFLGVSNLPQSAARKTSEALSSIELSTALKPFSNYQKINLNYINLGELNKNFVFRESILIKKKDD